MAPTRKWGVEGGEKKADRHRLAEQQQQKIREKIQVKVARARKKKNNFHQGDKSTSVSGWKNLHTPGDELEKETSLRQQQIVILSRYFVCNANSCAWVAELHQSAAVLLYTSTQTA
ncbi:hypothetical protein T02_10387 [Trichinella nativa]|uniref:Uncharacterized protein n=1 Tax=Trichinella nativa TaxID=6335 RepID=A0A0V1LUK4_9BILA|nr:hypothetical protein T02_10387 [Trichinella nativa]